MDKQQEIQENRLSYDANCSKTTKHDFVKFSKKTSKKYFEDKNSTHLNYSVQSGKNYFFNFCFRRCIYLDLKYSNQIKLHNNSFLINKKKFYSKNLTSSKKHN